MGMIVAEETYEVTVQRIEYHSGKTEIIHRIDDGDVVHGSIAAFHEPDREPLLELAYKGRFNALKEL